VEVPGQLVGTERTRKIKLAGGGDGGHDGSVLHEKERRRPFIDGRELERLFTSSPRRPGRSMGVVRRRRACVRLGYGGDAVGRSAQVGFAQPVRVWHVATLDWARTSAQGLGTGGHSGIPAFVPGLSAVRLMRPSARRRARARAVAVQNSSGPVQMKFFLFFQLKWSKV
jgi:hypothetical protein